MKRLFKHITFALLGAASVAGLTSCHSKGNSMTQQIPFKMFNYAYSATEETYSLGDALFEVDYINDSESWLRISGLLLPGASSSTTMNFTNLQMKVTEKNDAFIFKTTGSSASAPLNFEARITGAFMNPYYTFTTSSGATVKAVAQNAGYLTKTTVYNADGTINTKLSTESQDANRYYVQINEAHLSDSQRSLRLKIDYPSFPAITKRDVNGTAQYLDLNVVVIKEIPFNIINNGTLQFSATDITPSYSPDGTNLKDMEGYKVTDLTASGTLGGDITLTYNWTVPETEKTEAATYRIVASLVQILSTPKPNN